MTNKNLSNRPVGIFSVVYGILSLIIILNSISIADKISLVGISASLYAVYILLLKTTEFHGVAGVLENLIQLRRDVQFATESNEMLNPYKSSLDRIIFGESHQGYLLNIYKTEIELMDKIIQLTKTAAEIKPRIKSASGQDKIIALQLFEKYQIEIGGLIKELKQRTKSTKVSKKIYLGQFDEAEKSEIIEFIMKKIDDLDNHIRDLYSGITTEKDSVPNQSLHQSP